jgi:hypothetical protein
MLQPPVSDLTPWLPGHWITQTGYALNERDVMVGTKDNQRAAVMLQAVTDTDAVIRKVMRK